jgi:hypothetical protein
VLGCDSTGLEIDRGIGVHPMGHCRALADAGISSFRKRVDRSQLAGLEEIAPLIHDWPIPGAFKLERSDHLDNCNVVDVSNSYLIP